MAVPYTRNSRPQTSLWPSQPCRISRCPHEPCLLKPKTSPRSLKAIVRQLHSSWLPSSSLIISRLSLTCQRSRERNYDVNPNPTLLFEPREANEPYSRGQWDS